MSELLAKRLQTDMKENIFPLDEDTSKALLANHIASLADVVKVSLVCKSWNKLVKDNEMWKTLFLKLFRLKKAEIKSTEVYDAVTNLVSKWKQGWSCYWNEDDNEIDYDKYVFKPSLKAFTNATVFTKLNLNRNDVNYFKLAQDFAILGQIAKFTKNSMLSSESDYPFQPFICYYGDKELTPATFLERIGAHQELLNEGAIQNQNYGKSDYEEEEDQEREYKTEKQVATWFNENWPVNISFYSGSGKLNPVPFFQVTKSPNGTNNVIGVISALTHT